MGKIERIQKATQTHLKTLGLLRENIFIQYYTHRVEGFKGTIYLSIIQWIAEAVDKSDLELINVVMTVIFELYPTNDFWTETLNSFI
jgi:hypothetical protein